MGNVETLMKLYYYGMETEKIIWWTCYYTQLTTGV